jgi:hypothetical protein
MTDPTALTLRSRSLGALPVVQHVLDRLGLDKLLEQYVPQNDRRFRIQPATALGILLRNIILGRRPIYGLQEWAQPFVPALLGLGADRLEDVWRVVVAPNRSAEGYRIVWVWSQLMAQRNEQSRLATLQKAFDGIQELNDKLQGPHNRLRDRVAVEEAVERILANGGASRWAGVEVTEGVDSRFKQERRGRPGAGTRYVKVERSRFTVAWKPKADVIAYDARSDGMYPLITNCDDLPAGDVLQKYKYQPNLEKRHEQLKTVYAVAPAFLKDEGRIEALLLLYFVALLVQALIERQVRTSMKAEKLRVLPLYPEDRECQAPTANRILEVFENLQRHDLMEGATLRKCFEPKLTPLQEDLLRLLGAPWNTYGLATPGMDS